MSLVIMIIVVGWLLTCAMIGCSALNESGKLTEIRARIAAWKKTSGLPDAAISDAAVESATRVQPDVPGRSHSTGQVPWSRSPN